MSVLVDSVPVEFGETISRTGSMIVRCDSDYILMQNGVVWTPIGKIDGADQYVLSSSGRVEISVSGRTVFMFTVSLESDFTIRETYARFTTGEVVHESTSRSSRKYLQADFPNSERDGIFLYVYPTNMEDVRGLTATVNQGNIAYQEPQSSWVVIRLKNLVPSQYCQIFLGNTLVAFITPV